MKIAATLLTLALCLAARASDDEFRKAIYDCVVKDMGENAFKRFVKAADDKYEEWQKDNGGMAFKVYLDSKLLEKAPSVRGGEVEPVKEFIQWHALYYLK